MSDRIYVDRLSLSLRIRRLAWGLVCLLFFRPTPRWLFDQWRIFLLRLFGAKIGIGCRVAPSCSVWAPWNLSIGDRTALAEGVECYCVDRVSIGSNVCVSQRAFLCTASHDIRTLQRPLAHRPIMIQDHGWICAEAFVGPGVTLGEGAVVAARAVVMHDVAAWKVVGGNPAKLIKDRDLEEEAR